MKTKEQIKRKIKKLEKDYSPDGRVIRLIREPAVKNRAMVKVLKWVLNY